MKTIVLLAMFLSFASAEAKTRSSVSNNPCQAAAEEATARVATADAELQNKEDKNAGATFGGISESTVDESDPTLFHVVYSFNEECLAGTVVKTHLSSDGKTCTASDSDVVQDGQPDCG